MNTDNKWDHQGDPNAGASGHPESPNISPQAFWTFGIKTLPQSWALVSTTDGFFIQSNPPNSQIR